MGNFDVKVQRFLDIFIGNQAYLQVLEGLKNTIIIAVTGLLIGIVIGTLIATGTPAGVGMGFVPPKFLQVGDVVECIVEGIGTLKNTIVE